MIGALDAYGTTFYLTDALGSLLASFSNTANSAALKSNQLYAPDGNSRYTSGTLNTAKGFTGQYNDALTGLDYYNARYYDPVVGVFLSADNAEGNPQGMNPYGYVSGNPETGSDPTGQFVIDDGKAGVGAIDGNLPSSTTGVTVPDVFQSAFGYGELDPTQPAMVSSGADDGLSWSVTNGNTTTQYSTDSNTGYTLYWVYRGGMLVAGGDLPDTGGVPIAANGAILAAHGIKFHFSDSTSGSGGTHAVPPTPQSGSGGQGGRPPSNNRPFAGQFPEDPSGNRILPTDLFRRGNAGSPKADHVRIPGINDNPDVFPDENGNICPNQGGISTFEAPQAGKWWKLPAGTELPEGLQLRNDHGTHWLIEPAEEMSVDTFRQLLGSIQGWTPCF